MRKVALAFGLIMAIVDVKLASAAVISVQPQVAKFYEPVTFSELTPLPTGINPGHLVIVQVDVTMEVLSLAAGEDSFGVAAFNVRMGKTLPSSSGSISPVPLIGWTPNNVMFPVSGPHPTGFMPLLALNLDVGINAFDLKEFWLMLPPGPLRILQIREGV